MIWLFLPTWNVPLKVYLLLNFERCVSSPRPAMYSYLSLRRQLVKNHAFCFHSGPPKSPLRSICFLVALPLQIVSPERSKQRPLRENIPSSLGVFTVCR